MKTSNIVPITIPEDSLPGTYVAALKAGREWGGEALKRAVTIEIQGGNARPTTFVAAIDIRVHEVHDRSDRFNSLSNINDCAKCHLTPPNGPARGLLGNEGRR